MGQGEEVGEHEHAVDGVVLLVELGDGEHQDGADDVDLGGAILLASCRKNTVKLKPLIGMSIFQLFFVVPP